jgi:cobalt-zinc-cadmium efflux system membrane fusion protein
VILGVLLGSVTAHAHGDEDHAEPAAAPALAGTDARTAVAQTGSFELLLRVTPPEAGQPASLMAFVSDYATNAPIDGAKLTLEIQSTPKVSVTAEPTGAAGQYHLIAQVPPGEHDAIATIETADGKMDLLEVEHLDLTAAEVVSTPHIHATTPWGLIGGGAGLVLLLVIIALVWRRRRATQVAVLLGVLGASQLARSHGDEDHGTPVAATAPTGVPAGATYMAKESQFLLGVRTVVVKEQEVSSRVEAVGRVTPRLDGEALISAPLAGRILAPPGGQLVFIGDRVKKGQALFTIEQTLGAADAGDLRTRALEARTGLAQAKARRDQARRELARHKALEGIVAKQELEAAALALELAEREVELAGQQVALFGKGTLERVTVTAPIDGVIVEATIALGEQVPADKQLYRIVDTSRLWVEAEVFETDAPRVEAAGVAEVRVEGVPAPQPARVYRVGQVVNHDTRTVKVVVEVDNAKGMLRVGTFAQVAVAAGGATMAITVPDAAVIEEGGRRFVFVKLGPEVFARREVVLGTRNGAVWAVRAGLARGDRVVVQGTYQLRTSR